MTQEHDAETVQTDWEAFGRAILEDWQEHFDVDASEKFDLAVKYGALVPINDGFDPEKHTDWYGGAEKGDPWYQIVSAMPAREVTGWQPIETAPKDNTDILLGFAGQDRPPVVAGWFENAWLEYDSCNIAKGNPTHWKPLDPAPEVK